MIRSCKSVVRYKTRSLCTRQILTNASNYFLALDDQVRLITPPPPSEGGGDNHYTSIYTYKSLSTTSYETEKK